MMDQAQQEMGEGSANPTDPQHTPTITQPSSSKPQKKQKPKRTRRKDTQIPQSSVSIAPVADDAIYEERVNTFVDMDTELVKGSETRTEGSSKRAGEELEFENLKKHKLDENVEAEVDDEAEMKKHMEIVPDDEVEIDVIPLATKPPIVVDWKIIKEEKMGYFQIIRADGSSKRYSSMIKMLQNIDKEDLETL
ncbi:hypothetical protein Tco_0901756 [Tanacetum coccineum]